MMLYSCTHMATEGVKGLKAALYVTDHVLFHLASADAAVVFSQLTVIIISLMESCQATIELCYWTRINNVTHSVPLAAKYGSHVVQTLQGPTCAS